jgi:hypothetical protein
MRLVRLDSSSICEASALQWLERGPWMNMSQRIRCSKAHGVRPWADAQSASRRHIVVTLPKTSRVSRDGRRSSSCSSRRASSRFMRNVARLARVSHELRGSSDCERCACVITRTFRRHGCARRYGEASSTYQRCAVRPLSRESFDVQSTATHAARLCKRLRRGSLLLRGRDVLTRNHCDRTRAMVATRCDRAARRELVRWRRTIASALTAADSRPS